MRIDLTPEGAVRVLTLTPEELYRDLGSEVDGLMLHGIFNEGSVDLEELMEDLNNEPQYRQSISRLFEAGLLQQVED